MKSDPDLLRREEEELAKAIQLSLKETGSSMSKTPNNSTNSLYSTLSHSSHKISQKYSERKKVKALYDFEAAEDNEVTFKAGDIIILTDDSDQNWWKGIDTEGTEGLFPSNFVTFDLDEKVESVEVGKKVTFSDHVDVNSIDNNEPRQLSLYIDETKIDRCIEMLQNSDPTGEIQPDTQELLDLEEECYMMGPLIDQKLQLIDQKHSQLEDLNVKIIESFQMYNNLMKESLTKANSYIGPMVSSNSQANPQYVAAPPSLDQNPMQLANQLSSMSLNMQPHYPLQSQFQSFSQPMSGPYQNMPNQPDPSIQNQYLTNSNV